MKYKVKYLWEISKIVFAQCSFKVTLIWLFIVTVKQYLHKIVISFTVNISHLNYKGQIVNSVLEIIDVFVIIKESY
jgi:hypothetical protein